MRPAESVVRLKLMSRSQVTGAAGSRLTFRCRRNSSAENDTAPIAFLRPGEPLFDAFCDETIRRFGNEARRGGFFLDATAEDPYYAALYVCQLSQRSLRGGNTNHACSNAD